MSARLPWGDAVAKEPIPELGRFAVAATRSPHRQDAGADYIACVTSSTKSELGLGSHAVVARRFDTGEDPIEDDDRVPVLRVRCRLHVHEQSPGDGSEKALLDQTVRNALGIPYREPEPYRVDLAKLRRRRRQAASDFLGARLLRRRSVFMRVCSADPGDMEKELVRIPHDVFPLLGARPGERVIVTHPVRSDDEDVYKEEKTSVQAYALTAEIGERRRGRESPGLYDRYPDAAELLRVVPDLAPIYLDRQARDDLVVRSLEVVRVRRDDANAFLHRIRTVGLALVGASIAIVQVFPIDKTVWHGAWVLLGATVVAIAIAAADLRASAGSSGE